VVQRLLLDLLQVLDLVVDRQPRPLRLERDERDERLIYMAGVNGFLLAPPRWLFRGLWWRLRALVQSRRVRFRPQACWLQPREAYLTK
jgi:hypothetical protein